MTRRKLKQWPIALTIAGSDSGGGAGIQADLKVFAALSVHGTSAITCLTAQNPKKILGLQPATPVMVRQQIEAIFSELHPLAVKTGMLLSSEIILTVAEFFATGQRPPLIVDPVMISTSGTRLLQDDAMAALQKKLLPLATLVTPNLSETEVLVGTTVTTLEDMRAAARKIYEHFGCAALVKGGHLRGATTAADIYFDGQEELLLTAPVIKGLKTHGTGCVYSAAIAGYLSLGHKLPKAVALGKEFITQAIAQSYQAHGHFVLKTV